MINLFNTNIKDKHDFILLNKDNGKWFAKNNLLTSILTGGLKDLSLQNSPPINSGMGITEQQNYLDAKAKAYKAEQANGKTINDLRHFSSALLERTSEVFKPITTNQDKNQQLLSKSLEKKREFFKSN